MLGLNLYNTTHGQSFPHLDYMFQDTLYGHVHLSKARQDWTRARIYTRLRAQIHSMVQYETGMAGQYSTVHVSISTVATRSLDILANDEEAVTCGGEVAFS